MKKILNSASVVTMFLLIVTITSAQTNVNNVVHSRHRVAVMPINYIAEGNDNRVEEMRYFLQGIIISYMSNSAAELKFVDAVTVNALLLQNGINESNIRKYTPKELAAILQVEYVIMGSILQSVESVMTTENNHNTRKQTIENYGRDTKYTKRNSSHGSSVTRQNIETQVSLSIYNEMGERIYAKSRESILSEGDAYRNTLHYLLKRTPLYKR